MHPTYSALTVLIVDDSRCIRDVLREMLRELGVGLILEAHEGAQAIARCAESPTPVDLVFCDMAMPGLDGVQTLRAMAVAHPEIAVVPLSGRGSRLLASVTRLAEQIGLRVVAALSKPFTMEMIEQVLADTVRTRGEHLHGKPRAMSAEAIDRAIAERRVEVYYQPKISLADGSIAGVEALARIRDTEVGIIDPSAFIEVAEQDPERIERLTMEVIRQSIEQTGFWRRSGLGLKVAINLSTQAIHGVDLPDAISAIVSGAGLSNDCVTMEITESRVIHRPDVLDTITRFRLRDFGLAIDDFGTGESGLQRLKGLPFTELKIDRGFVAGVANDADARAILETSLELGHRLDMRVVAEGVERKRDWRVLEDLGCDEIQGYLAARPMPAQAIPDFVGAWNIASVSALPT